MPGHKVDINQISKQELRTVLLLAGTSFRTKIVRILLAHGAEYEWDHRYGFLAHDYAAIDEIGALFLKRKMGRSPHEDGPSDSQILRTLHVEADVSRAISATISNTHLCWNWRCPAPVHHATHPHCQ